MADFPDPLQPREQLRRDDSKCERRGEHGSEEDGDKCPVCEQAAEIHDGPEAAEEHEEICTRIRHDLAWQGLRKKEIVENPGCQIRRELREGHGRGGSPRVAQRVEEEHPMRRAEHREEHDPDEHQDKTRESVAAAV